MDKKAFEILLNKEIESLRYEFSEINKYFYLKINDHNIKFKVNPFNKLYEVSPNKWIKGVHRNNKIHEPGMIAAIILLSKTLNNKKVIFYDIGALFGYHLTIANSFFKDVKSIAVEGNPLFSNYIEYNNSSNLNVKVLNNVMDIRSEKNYYFILGFNFLKCKRLTYYFKIIILIFKNILKSFLNIFKKKKYKLQFGSYVKLSSIKLDDLFKYNNESRLEIFKIDTEGYQAIFLPPYIKKLSERKAIILLELDRPEKMLGFASSNSNILNKFKENNYLIYWLDHRSFNKASKIKKLESSQDKNSLAILIPKEMDYFH